MKQKLVTLNGESLSILKIFSIIKNSKNKINLSPESIKKSEIGHNFLKNSIQTNSKITYGINTGFGPMANYLLAHNQILELQKNLVLSHAVGMGEKIKDEFVHSAMLVRLNTLMRGHSGVSTDLLKYLEFFINKRILPVVPEHGAVGTSGDLVQLAHIALALIGKGEVSYKGEVQNIKHIAKILKLKPYTLKPKEGLALINGTSMMTGIASINCIEASNLLNLALFNGCLALELLKAYDDSYSKELHELRPHNGQVEIAKNIREILKSSKLVRNREVLHKNSNLGDKVNVINETVQEVYSMRCLSQILGPVYDTLSNTWKTTEIEMNSVTDNPIVDWKNKKFLHGGNFHGDYIAVAMDQLKISLVKLTMLSERRLNFFLNHKINHTFPPFLNLHTPGLTLGFQALQFVATSTTANSQTLGYPMNLHSISTNGDNQDVVSMGTDAALITNKVIENTYIVLAIETLALCQAVDYLKVEKKLSKNSKALYNFTRTYFHKIVEDRELQPELKNFLEKIKNWEALNLFKRF